MSKKKKILSEYKNGEYCDPNDFLIYKSEYDYQFMIYDKKKEKLIIFRKQILKKIKLSIKKIIYLNLD